MEFSFHDSESPQLDIALESQLFKSLHDIFYYGRSNERLQIFIQLTAEYTYNTEGYYDRKRKQVEIAAENVELDTSENAEKLFRYIEKDITLPDIKVGGQLVWTSLEMKWKISVELELNDLVDLTGLLPQVSDQKAKMLEEKLFCDFEFLSSDGVSIPCHKVIISASSDSFRAKCMGKLEEPSKNQMVLKMTEESVHALLEFIYCGNVRKPMNSSLIASELFQEGHTYHIAGLEKAMVSLLLQKPNEWYDVDVAFNLLRFVVDYEGEFSSELTKKFIEALAVSSFLQLSVDFFKEQNK